MALSGPEGRARLLRPRRRTRPAPRREHANRPEPNVVSPIQPKFGLDVFKELERNGS